MTHLATAACPKPFCPRVMELTRHVHDELSQSLAFAMLRLDEAQSRGDLTALSSARQAVRQALQASRHLLKGLPSTNAGLDLAAALRAALATLRQEQSTRELHFLNEGTLPDLEPQALQVLLSATRELLVNACKHGGAGAVETRLSGQPHRLAITVSNAHSADPCAAWMSSGHGLALTQTRLHSIGARLRWRQAASQVQARITWSSS